MKKLLYLTLELFNPFTRIVPFYFLINVLSIPLNFPNFLHLHMFPRCIVHLFPHIMYMFFISCKVFCFTPIGINTLMLEKHATTVSITAISLLMPMPNIYQIFTIYTP